MRDTRESIEEDFRYDTVNALLDLFLMGEVTLVEVQQTYLQTFPEQRQPSE